MSTSKKTGTKYYADQLSDYIMEETTSEICCSNCGKIEGKMHEGAENVFFKEGWRATSQNVYCPGCAKKKLK